jgi:hypothetical protein
VITFWLAGISSGEVGIDIEIRVEVDRSSHRIRPGQTWRRGGRRTGSGIETEEPAVIIPFVAQVQR